MDPNKMKKVYGAGTSGHNIDNIDKFAAADKALNLNNIEEGITELVLVSVKLSPQDNQIVKDVTKKLILRDFTKVKQSEIIRLGLSMLENLSEDQLVEKFENLPKIKTGPNKKK